MTREANPVQPFLDQHGVMILDGGLATELEARGQDLGDDLWSARLLLDDPGLVRQVHLDYLEAGADCVTSASYQATFQGWRRRGLSGDEAAGLLRRSVDLAREARDSFAAAGRLRPLVAASVGPYGAYLADGSEYTGDYDLDEDGLVEFHRRRFEVLAASGADLLACETIPSLAEARALARLLRGSSTWAWLAFSCRDGRRLSDGHDLADAVAEVCELPRVVAVGVNCTSPRFVSDLIGEVRRVTGKPVVVYPNSGESYDAVGKRWLPAPSLRGGSGETQAPSLRGGGGETQSPVDFASAVREWRAAGACLIGGCCRTRPRDVRRIRERLLGDP